MSHHANKKPSSRSNNTKVTVILPSNIQTLLTHIHHQKQANSSTTATSETRRYQQPPNEALVSLGNLLASQFVISCSTTNNATTATRDVQSVIIEKLMDCQIPSIYYSFFDTLSSSTSSTTSTDQNSNLNNEKQKMALLESWCFWIKEIDSMHEQQQNSTTSMMMIVEDLMQACMIGFTRYVQEISQFVEPTAKEITTITNSSRIESNATTTAIPLLNLYQNLHASTQGQLREHLFSYSTLLLTNDEEEIILFKIPSLRILWTYLILNPYHLSYNDKLCMIQSQLSVSSSSSDGSNTTRIVVEYHVQIIQYYIHCYWNKTQGNTTMLFIWKWMMILFRTNNNVLSNNSMNQLLSNVLPLYHCNDNTYMQGNLPWKEIMKSSNTIKSSTQINILHCILSTVHVQDCTNMLQLLLLPSSHSNLNIERNMKICISCIFLHSMNTDQTYYSCQFLQQLQVNDTNQQQFAVDESDDNECHLYNLLNTMKDNVDVRKLALHLFQQQQSTSTKSFLSPFHQSIYLLLAFIFIKENVISIDTMVSLFHTYPSLCIRAYPITLYYLKQQLNQIINNRNNIHQEKILDLLKLSCHLSSNSHVCKQIWTLFHSSSFSNSIPDVIIRLYPMLLQHNDTFAFVNKIYHQLSSSSTNTSSNLKLQVSKWNTIMDICQHYPQYGIEFLDLFSNQEYTAIHWYGTYCTLMSLHYLYQSDQLSYQDMMQVVMQWYKDTNIIQHYKFCLDHAKHDRVVTTWIFILGDVVSATIQDVNQKIFTVAQNDTTQRIMLEKDKKQKIDLLFNVGIYIHHQQQQYDEAMADNNSKKNKWKDYLENFYKCLNQFSLSDLELVVSATANTQENETTKEHDSSLNYYPVLVDMVYSTLSSYTSTTSNSSSSTYTLIQRILEYELDSSSFRNKKQIMLKSSGKISKQQQQSQQKMPSNKDNIIINTEVNMKDNNNNPLSSSLIKNFYQTNPSFVTASAYLQSILSKEDNDISSSSSSTLLQEMLYNAQDFYICCTNQSFLWFYCILSFQSIVPSLCNNEEKEMDFSFSKLLDAITIPDMVYMVQTLCLSSTNATIKPQIRQDMITQIRTIYKRQQPSSQHNSIMGTFCSAMILPYYSSSQNNKGSFPFKNQELYNLFQSSFTLSSPQSNKPNSLDFIGICFGLYNILPTLLSMYEASDDDDDNNTTFIDIILMQFQSCYSSFCSSENSDDIPWIEFWFTQHPKSKHNKCLFQVQRSQPSSSTDVDIRIITSRQCRYLCLVLSRIIPFLVRQQPSKVKSNELLMLLFRWFSDTSNDCCCPGTGYVLCILFPLLRYYSPMKDDEIKKERERLWEYYYHQINDSQTISSDDDICATLDNITNRLQDNLWIIVAIYQGKKELDKLYSLIKNCIQVKQVSECCLLLCNVLGYTSFFPFWLPRDVVSYDNSKMDDDDDDDQSNNIKNYYYPWVKQSMINDAIQLFQSIVHKTKNESSSQQYHLFSFQEEAIMSLGLLDSMTFLGTTTSTKQQQKSRSSSSIVTRQQEKSSFLFTKIQNLFSTAINTTTFMRNKDEEQLHYISQILPCFYHIPLQSRMFTKFIKSVLFDSANTKITSYNKSLKASVFHLLLNQIDQQKKQKSLQDNYKTNNTRRFVSSKNNEVTATKQECKDIMLQLAMEYSTSSPSLSSFWVSLENSNNALNNASSTSKYSVLLLFMQSFLSNIVILFPINDTPSTTQQDYLKLALLSLWKLSCHIIQQSNENDALITFLTSIEEILDSKNGNNPNDKHSFENAILSDFLIDHCFQDLVRYFGPPGCERKKCTTTPKEQSCAVWKTFFQVIPSIQISYMHNQNFFAMPISSSSRASPKKKEEFDITISRLTCMLHYISSPKNSNDIDYSSNLLQIQSWILNPDTIELCYKTAESHRLLRLLSWDLASFILLNDANRPKIVNVPQRFILQCLETLLHSSSSCSSSSSNYYQNDILCTQFQLGLELLSYQVGYFCLDFYSFTTSTEKQKVQKSILEAIETNTTLSSLFFISGSSANEESSASVLFRSFSSSTLSYITKMCLLDLPAKFGFICHVLDINADVRNKINRILSNLSNNNTIVDTTTAIGLISSHVDILEKMLFKCHCGDDNDPSWIPLISLLSQKMAKKCLP